MAPRFRAGPFELWSSVGGEVDVHSANEWPFIEKQGLTKEASGHGWDETIMQMQAWLISNPEGLGEARRDFMNNVLTDPQRRRLALKLWLAAGAKEPLATDI